MKEFAEKAQKVQDYMEKVEEVIVKNTHAVNFLIEETKFISEKGGKIEKIQKLIDLDYEENKEKVGKIRNLLEENKEMIEKITTNLLKLKSPLTDEEQIIWK